MSVLERMADVLSSTAMPVKMLTTQYRMHPNICRFVSAHFYNKRLETDESRALACAPAARERPEPPIVWRTHGGRESRAEHSTSTENREEARIICGEILPALFADPHYAGKKIVIITMYKAQLRLLEQMFTEHQHTGKAAVMTVDSAQGSEADIVILSLVRSNAQRHIGFARDRQRINVALSRAKDCLLIVGNAQCFESDRVWRDLWRAASQEGGGGAVGYCRADVRRGGFSGAGSHKANKKNVEPSSATASWVATETLRNAGGVGREMIETEEAVQTVGG